MDRAFQARLRPKRRCGNCRHLRIRHSEAVLPGGLQPLGSCALVDPSKTGHMTRWCNEDDWCDKWKERKDG